MKQREITPEQMAYDLFQIHGHMPEADLLGLPPKMEERVSIALPPPGIVYREKDLIRVLKKWGLPKPKFSGKKYLDLFNKHGR